MIRDTLNRRQNPAITSDQWHVVHARWSGDASAQPRFERSIVSEHEDRASAVIAARAIVTSLWAEMATRPLSTRDQIFIRRPAYRSLKTARRVARRRK